MNLTPVVDGDYATSMSNLDVIIQFLLVLVPFGVVFTIVWIVMVVLQANASDALTQFEKTFEAALEEEADRS